MSIDVMLMAMFCTMYMVGMHMCVMTLDRLIRKPSFDVRVFALSRKDTQVKYLDWRDFASANDVTGDSWIDTLEPRRQSATF